MIRSIWFCLTIMSSCSGRKRLKASATQCSTGALLRMLRHGGSQPRIKEGASHHARRGKNAEAFLIMMSFCEGEGYEKTM